MANLLLNMVSMECKGSIDKDRMSSLNQLVHYLSESLLMWHKVQIIFVCTHNSRRSQFSQTWGQFAADHFDLAIQCFSGGTEVTACNPRTIASLQRSGLILQKKTTEGDNPRYAVASPEINECLELYSKLVDDPCNPRENFAAVMTCDHADKNCPTILGAERRIPIRYEDPKAFDDSPQEKDMYDQRSLQIAKEMYYVMKKTKDLISQQNNLH